MRLYDHNPFAYCECSHDLRRHQTGDGHCGGCECQAFVDATSPVLHALGHLLYQLRRNGVDVTQQVRDRTHLILKEKLFLAEREIFFEAMNVFDAHVPSDPPTAKDIRVYQSGAFNLEACAPGGILEVGENYRPVSWEKPMCEICVMDGTKHSVSMCSAKAARKLRNERE